MASSTSTVAPNERHTLRIGIDAIERLDRMRGMEPAVLTAVAVDAVLAHQAEEHVGRTGDGTHETLAALTISSYDFRWTDRRERRHHETAGASGRATPRHRSLDNRHPRAAVLQASVHSRGRRYRRRSSKIRLYGTFVL